ncbi:MAG: M48 family metallopeptidase [Acidimicrobiales bacterium]
MYSQIARNKRKSVAYIVLFITVWVGIGALLGWVWWSATGGTPSPGRPGLATSPVPATGDVVTGMVIAAVLAGVGVLLSLTSGTRLVLAASGAHPADPAAYPQLHHVVEALAIGDGLPKPDIYVIDDPSPNAFATGTSPGHAAVTVTTGLLALMSRTELEGVIAHELSHIKNYDVRLLLIISTLIGMAGLIASLIWRSAFFMRGGRDRNGGQAMVVVLLAGILLSIVAFVFGPLVRLALSRRRESLADASGVELTRNPAGLISALEKLQANDQPFARFNHATAAMCIDDPLQHHEGWIHHLFDTHPPLEERIEALRRIELGLTA